MSALKIKVPRKRIADFCQRYHIRKLAFFGSVLRDDFGPNSDVDVLVEFEPGHVPGLAFFAMQEELSKILGHKVDLNTKGFISKYFREEVLRDSRVEVEKMEKII
ncbi:MAG: nucleotidyltransferase family protein [Chloroflexota bacterium]